MVDKKVVSTSTQKSTKETTKPDGTIVETITTTITEKYQDGSTGIKTSLETTIKPGKGVAPGTVASVHSGGLPGTVSSTYSTVGGASSASNLSPAQCTAPKVENTTNATFIQEALNEHNILRAKHGSPPLVLNADLGKISQAWVNQLAKQGSMQHSTCGFGENVYWNTESIDGKRAVDQWYSEIKDYNWKKMEGQKGTGHFTQVIWKSTMEMGVAMAKGSNGYYVVANYNPPGNFVGKYADNLHNI